MPRCPAQGTHKGCPHKGCRHNDLLFWAVSSELGSNQVASRVSAKLDAIALGSVKAALAGGGSGLRTDSIFREDLKSFLAAACYDMRVSPFARFRPLAESYALWI